MVGSWWSWGVTEQGGRLIGGIEGHKGLWGDYSLVMRGHGVSYGGHKGSLWGNMGSI